MSVDLTTEGLIGDIKRSGGFPDGLFSDDDYVSFINDSFANVMLPFIMKHREDYFLTYTDYTAANSIEIPADAIAQKIKDVVLVDSSDNYINVPRLSIEEISGLYGNATTALGFYIEDNTIKFYPTNANSTTIRIYYFKRPSFIIHNDDAAKIVSITGASAVVNAVPTGWTTATEIDIISHLQPYVATTTYTMSNIVSTTITLSASGAAKNNYICPKGYTVYPKIPVELRELLTKSAIESALMAIKDVAGLEVVQKNIKELMKDLATLISPRVDGEVKKIVNNSGIWKQGKSRYGMLRRY